MSWEDYGKKTTIMVGPWGGQDGFQWDDGDYSTVRQLIITHAAGIDSIRIEYDRKGTSVWTEMYGGSGGTKTDQVKLDYPDEFLTSFHGYYGSLNEWGPTLIRSITFESNKRSFGPYGVEQGIPFSFPMIGGKIVGFHGKYGWYIDAIGAHLEPIQKSTTLSSTVRYSQGYTLHENEKLGYSMIQGNLGKDYDLIVALRRKEQYANNNSLPDIISLSRQSSSPHEFKHAESNNKILGLPSTIERVPSKNVQGVVTYGPWGGNGGTVFDEGLYDGIQQIRVSRNVGIVSIRACYIKNGQAVWGSKNGGTGGFKADKMVFDYPTEVLTHITGYFGPTMIMGPTVIKSLTFHTTKAVYGPFGEEVGHSFSTNLREGMIVGFHGRKGLFIDAIGVHVVEGKVQPAISCPSNSSDHREAPILSSNSSNQSEVSANEVDTPKWSFKLGRRGLSQEGDQRVVKDPSPHGPGPWGGDGGKPWDDGVFTGIKQIILTSSHTICSIEIEYDRNGQSVWSVKHGGNGGQASHKIKLEYPHEVLTCISGFYGPISREEGTKVIKALTFHTSRRKYGPFGEELGSFFTSNTTEGKVVGFHGRSSMYLDAIGVHMQHWLGNQRSTRPSSLKKIFS
ncbi:hypothetical protein RJ639_013065 [Escallonia herrerae]|uniref:Jacalin-type lectin domain-containing protein n=1 Tax=Escallonia herrerae TaxID=1293975 RepID=A0AA88VLR9_9ASTE|nr:hypothetical protein RJ639_013065 [Escallonia herrerae]